MEQIGRPIDVLRLELRRVGRDRRNVVCFLIIFALPIVKLFWPGIDLPGALPLTILFFPLLIGWTWGRDLSSRAIAPLLLARVSPVQLYAGRAAAMIVLAGAGATPALLLVDPAPWLTAMFILHVVLFGFFVTTVLRSPDAGWVPLTLAILSILSIIGAMKSEPLSRIAQQGDSGSLSVIVQVALVGFFPSVAEAFSLLTRPLLLLVYGSLSALWLLGGAAIVSCAWWLERRT